MRIPGIQGGVWPCCGAPPCCASLCCAAATRGKSTTQSTQRMTRRISFAAIKKPSSGKRAMQRLSAALDRGEIGEWRCRNRAAHKSHARRREGCLDSQACTEKSERRCFGRRVFSFHRAEKSAGSRKLNHGQCGPRRCISLYVSGSALGSCGHGNLAANIVHARRCSHRWGFCRLLSCRRGSCVWAVLHVHLRGFRHLRRLSGLACRARKVTAGERARKVAGGGPGCHRQKENGEQTRK